MTERPLVTVGGLIVAPDGEILLVQSVKWKNLYSMPGGKVELGESREEAFQREVWEETGLKIKNLRFAIVQDSIYSKEFWQKKHFVMNDFIAELDPLCTKDQVVLNDEAHAYIWINPKRALELPLHHECRLLVEWYLAYCNVENKSCLGVLGIYQHKISCKIGVYPEEREQAQTVLVDVKIKVDFSDCIASGKFQDTSDYVAIAHLCTELAQNNDYLLLEKLAADIVEECFNRFPAVWAWVCIKKPAAISEADYAFVELERFNEGKRHFFS